MTTTTDEHNVKDPELLEQRVNDAERRVALLEEKISNFGGHLPSEWLLNEFRAALAMAHTKTGEVERHRDQLAAEVARLKVDLDVARLHLNEARDQRDEALDEARIQREYGPVLCPAAAEAAVRELLALRDDAVARAEKLGQERDALRVELRELAEAHERAVAGESRTRAEQSRAELAERGRDYERQQLHNLQSEYAEMWRILAVAAKGNPNIDEKGIPYYARILVDELNEWRKIAVDSFGVSSTPRDTVAAVKSLLNSRNASDADLASARRERDEALSCAEKAEADYYRATEVLARTHAEHVSAVVERDALRIELRERAEALDAAASEIAWARNVLSEGNANEEATWDTLRYLAESAMHRTSAAEGFKDTSVNAHESLLGLLDVERSERARAERERDEARADLSRLWTAITGKPGPRDDSSRLWVAINGTPDPRESRGAEKAEADDARTHSTQVSDLARAERAERELDAARVQLNIARDQRDGATERAEKAERELNEWRTTITIGSFGATPTPNAVAAAIDTLLTYKKNSVEDIASAIRERDEAREELRERSIEGERQLFDESQRARKLERDLAESKREVAEWRERARRVEVVRDELRTELNKEWRQLFRACSSDGSQSVSSAVAELVAQAESNGTAWRSALNQTMRLKEEREEARLILAEVIDDKDDPTNLSEYARIVVDKFEAERERATVAEATAARRQEQLEPLRTRVNELENELIDLRTRASESIR